MRGLRSLIRSLIRIITRFLYRRLRYTALVQAAEEEFEIQSYSGVTSRHYEFPFGVSETVGLSKQESIKKILDAGTFGSPFGLILASLGFKVTGVDIVPWKVEFENFGFVRADLKNLPFKNDSFDCVTAISTIEHCGLPRFGEKEGPNGDLVAMREIYRVLRPRGYCLLTVPFASRYSIFLNKHRIYNSKRFKKLIYKFRTVKKKFFGPIDDRKHFRPCTLTEIKQIDPRGKGDYGIICVVLQK